MTKADKDRIGGSLYNLCITKLEDSVFLTKSKRIEIAKQVDAEAKMNSDSAKECVEFLAKWRKSRRLMYREELVRPNTEILLQYYAQLGAAGPQLQELTTMHQNLDLQDMHEFMNKRISPLVYEYVYDKDPKSIDQVLTLIEKYIEMKKRTDKSSGVIKIMDGGIAVLQDQDGNELSWGGSVADSVPGDVPQYDENGNYIYAMKGGKGGYGASFAVSYTHLTLPTKRIV